VLKFIRCASLRAMSRSTHWRAVPRGAVIMAPRALRALIRLRSVAAAALLVYACVLASATTALAASPPPIESIVVFEGQLNGHQVSAVTLRTRAHTFHVTLTDGRKVRIAFPPSQQQRLLNDIETKGIAVKVAKAQPPPSHKLRYIVGGIVIVAVVVAVVGLLLYMRRRRLREEEEWPGAPA
jgi:ATP-dependent Zn protease